MKRRDFLVSAMMASVAAAARPLGLGGAAQPAATRKILIAGGGFGTAFIRYMAELTGRPRPKIVEGLGFLKGSHSPHYDAEKSRRPLYHELIGSGRMKPGYACDNNAGIYFEDNEVRRVVATRDGAKVYHVSVVGGQVVERVLEPELIA